MAKEKKQLTVKQKQKRYRTYQYLTFGGEFLSVITPFVVMGAINYQEWFMVEEGWKVGIGGALALALMGIATFLLTSKKENKELTDGFITFLIGWFMVAFVFKLMSSIMDQIFQIMMFGGIGILGAFGLNILSKGLKKKADIYQEVLNEVKEDTLKERAKKELEKEDKVEF